jgi:hypothetical protein
MPEMNISYAMADCYSDIQSKSDEKGYWSIMHYKILLYREPEYQILTSYIPILVLNLFTLAVFQVDATNYEVRLGVAITILLSLIAFMPTARRNIPIPHITCVDVSIYVAIILLLLLLADSFIGSRRNRGTIAGFWIAGVAIVGAENLHLVCEYIRYLCRKKKYKNVSKFKERLNFRFREDEWQARTRPVKFNERDCTAKAPRIKASDHYLPIQ